MSANRMNEYHDGMNRVERRKYFQSHDHKGSNQGKNTPKYGK